MTRPKTIDEIDTPAVLIDIDRAAANIARAQAYADKHGIKLRPHIKTHKLPYWAEKQLQAGAIGITCQKVTEAEIFADAGINDIFLPYNIVGSTKLERLKALHGRVTLSVTADSRETIAGMAGVFVDSERPLSVLIECDTGGGRCGVQSAAEVVALAQQIRQHPGLTFGGLMTFPPVGKQQETDTWLTAARDALAAEQIDCARITSGGTPGMWGYGGSEIITEYRPGTYIYMDRYQVAQGAATADDCALTVLATVVSHPTATRAVLDSGSKALTSDTLGMNGFGEIIGKPGALVTGLSEEHGVVTLGDGATLNVGERVRILPNHCCVVSNLFDQVYFISGDTVVDVMPVAARGRVA